MNPTSLHAQIRMLVAGILLILGVSVSIGLWFLANGALESRLESDVSAAVHQLQEAMRQRKALLSLQSRTIAEHQELKLVVIDPEAGKNVPTITSNLESLRNRLHAEGVSYQDADGKVLASTGIRPEEISPPSLTQIDRMSEGLVSEKVELIATGKGFMLAATTPVRFGAKVFGVLTTYSLVGQQAATDLATALGVEIAFLNDEGIVAGSLPELSQAWDGSRASQIVPTAVGNFAARVVPMEGRASVAVFRSTEEAVANFRNLLAVFLAILGFSIVGAMALAGRFAKGITRPLEQVVAAAAELEEGRWPEPLPITRRNEIGILKNVFNEMVASLQESQKRLLAMVDADPLTELENHRRFKESLTHEVARRSESGDELSLVVFDLDEFKLYNERYGHAAGDAALCAVARVLRETAPEFATCARFGGEEFAVLLPLYNLDRAAELAEQVRAEFSKTSGLKERLTLSAGCAQLGTNTAEADGLAVAAELAVWRAKQLGRNRVCRFDGVPGAGSSADPAQLHRFYQDASLSTIQALAAAVDAKDAYTNGHSTRVAQYAADLARFVGATQQEIDLVYRTGTLHDVGKIGVPDSILKKTDKLDDEERAIMETHPLLGEEIVRKVPQLEETLPGVRHHHERWDGKGYPDGLAGEAIPYIARLLALADTYDAMTSDRPYRKGMPEEVALRIIAEEAGTQFDPELAPAFVELMRKSSQQKAA